MTVASHAVVGRDGGDAIPARVFLRPIGSPLTVGMSGLAIASLVESGLSLSWLAKTQVHDVGLILIAVPFVLQLVACVFAYLARDGAAGAALGILATTWLGLGLVHLLAKPGSVSGALGLMLLATGGTLALSSGAVGVAKPLAAAVFLLSAIRFGIDGVYELSAVSAWQDAGGIVGLAVTGVASYAVLAFELEGERHRPVLPTFRRGPGVKSITASGLAQLDGVANEAGVRETT
jgi:succinate-acetate transporter protein